MSQKTPEQLQAARIRNQRYTAKHPERRKAYRDAHKEENKARCAAYYAAHREELLAKQRAYNATHRKQKAITGRAYRLANQETIRLKRQAQYHADRECMLERNHANYQAHREQRLAANKQWAQDNPEKVRAIKARYRQSHRESLQAKGRAYIKKRYEEYTQEELLKSSVWRKTHPEVFREAVKRRRARKAGAPLNDLTPAQWAFIKNHYGHRCVYCGRKMKHLTQDHITPLSRGGNHTVNNVVPACRSCNSKKAKNNVLIPIQPLLIASPLILTKEDL